MGSLHLFAVAVITATVAVTIPNWIPAAAFGEGTHLSPRILVSGNSIARPVIVIDPGYPSEDGVGASGHGVAEVHAAWEVAVRLRDSLAAAGTR